MKNTIIDAEIACLDSEGKSVFLDLMRRRKAEAILFAFDLLWLDDEDMRGWPLLERKRRLRDLIRGHPGLLYAEHIEAKGTELFRAICARDLEGIVCKHRLAPYSARPQSWYKVLNSDYGQKRGRREMFEKFYERGEGVSPA